jgi:hypothetical protein
MARWLVLVSMILGLGGWLRNAGPDQADFGAPSVAAPDVQIMDGSDPFPH